MRACLTALLLLHALVLPGALAQEALPSRYAAVRPSPDGIGKVYLGREIAQVMGFHGAQWLERPERMEEERPDRVLAALELKPGMTVADVGAGNGNMSVVFGKWIGSGRVFATDIPQKTIAWLREYVKREGLTNVTVIEGAAASTNLPAACCDAISSSVLSEPV